MENKRDKFKEFIEAKSKENFKGSDIEQDEIDCSEAEEKQRELEKLEEISEKLRSLSSDELLNRYWKNNGIYQ